MKLDKLKDYIPKVDDKSNEIYQKANEKKKKFSLAISIRIVSLATLCLITLLCVILIFDRDKDETKDPTVEMTEEVTDGDYETPELSPELVPQESYESFMLKGAKVGLNMTDYKNYVKVESNEAAIFLDKLDSFSHKLSVEIYNDYEGNYLISPVSIYMGLAMVIECTSGDTREEILDVVGVTYDEVKNFTKYIYGLTNRQFRDADDRISAFEELANSIWIEEKIDLKEACLEALSEYYHTDSLHVPFNASPKHASKLLNKYIKDKTHDLIDLSIEISPETLFMLINTYYIKEIWLGSGEELFFTDSEYDFLNNDLTITKTKLLKGTYSTGQIYERENFYHFTQKSYHGYRMKFIVPKDGFGVDDIFNYKTLKEVNNIKDYKGIDDVNMIEHFTRVLFPEFSVSLKKEISSDLKNLGIKRIYGNADFTNITDIPAYVGATIHATKLNVDARGFEGAAVTVFEVPESDAPSDYEKVLHELVVDKEFVFILTNSKNIVLFTGVIKNLEK